MDERRVASHDSSRAFQCTAIGYGLTRASRRGQDLAHAQPYPALKSRAGNQFDATRRRYLLRAYSSLSDIALTHYLDSEHLELASAFA